MPGVSGMENNTILFEVGTHDPEEVLDEIMAGLSMSGVPGMNRLVLRHGGNFFGGRRTLHVWLTWSDAENANLMILLAYILLGHRDWHGAEIEIFAVYPKREVQERAEALHSMISEGRLLISEKNLTLIPTDEDIDLQHMVEARSGTADLVLLGFTTERLERRGRALFERFPALRDALFVSAEETIKID